MQVRLEAFGAYAPAGGEALLRDLGTGENGFGGTRFATGELDLRDYLRECVAQQSEDQLPPDRVPQTHYWIVQADRAVGMLRMRHRLNPSLRIVGGHIGFYIRPADRRHGIASRALALALHELAARGEPRALLTTDADNAASTRVILRNGGHLEAELRDPHTGTLIHQFWIDLPPS